MTITRENGKWVVRDRRDEWEFSTHKEAEEKANRVNVEKLSAMSQGQ